MLIPFCQQNDYGFALMIQCVDGNGNPVNLANATSIAFIITAPDGTVANKTGLLYQGGISGKIYYVLVSNDLSQFGRYTVQVGATLPSGSVVKSQRRGLQVYPNTAL